MVSKAFANQIITFNINGGIARLNINLMAGKYIITSMYSNGDTISNHMVT